MHFRFILVNPELPENVGSAARAMHTMGFSDLCIVNGCDHLSRRARALAHGSEALLEKAVRFSTLNGALSDIDFSIATTARRRHNHAPALTPLPAIPGLLRDKGSSVNRVAMVFGNEDTGIANADLDLCDLVSYIPMAQPQPSLNLAQAVMVAAYSLSANPVKTSGRFAEGHPQFKSLKQRADALFSCIGIRSDGLFRRQALKKLSLLSVEDMKLLHFFVSHCSDRLNRSRPC